MSGARRLAIRVTAIAAMIWPRVTIARDIVTAFDGCASRSSWT